VWLELHDILIELRPVVSELTTKIKSKNAPKKKLPADLFCRVGFFEARAKQF
jgi:hypothetical protein